VSCGDPHETPCSEVLETVYLYLDNECDQEARDHVRLHLDECSPCLRKYGLEQAVIKLVARSCQEQAPDDLRAKVMLKIQQVRVDIEHVEYTSE
jgi:mycothiol system anti-sigma-R factor